MAETMRVAILDAVPERYWQDDEGFTDGDKFFDLLYPQMPGCEIDIFYAAADELPRSVDDYDGYLVGGSPASARDDDDWIARLAQFVVDADARDKRILACCFGHQLVARTWGGEVGANEHGWYIGNYELEIRQRFAWMDPAVEVTGLYHFNQERVTRLPDGAASFADSPDYPDFAYTLGDNILCVQGHPEQPMRAMNNFLASVAPQLTDDELRLARERIDFGGAPDAAVWARWMARFWRD